MPLNRRFFVAGYVALFPLLSLAACFSEPEARILFVGNSYTANNDLPGNIAALAKSAGHPVEVDARAPGGWWLRDHAGSSDTLDKIATGDFDFVVLQEQSMAPADSRFAERESVPAARRLSTRIDQSGARTVMFMTWGHRGGSREVGHRSYDSMQVAIADTYERLGEVVVGPVAPVGAAWWMARAERPDIVLYESDGNHPSAYGTYLAAAVLAATILDIDPTEFDTDLELIPDYAAALREFASRAVSGERPWE
jgi:hypothetical protein